MKLASDALIAIIEILRVGITEGKDVSQMLRDLDLIPNESGMLAVNRLPSGGSGGSWVVETD